MKKGILVFSILSLAFIGGYALTTTMTDLFAVGDTGSGPLFRISSTGGIVNSGNNTFGGTSTMTGVVTLTAAPISSSGKYGMTTSASNTVYSVLLATTMALGSSVDLTLADGKIGMFEVIAGTACVYGSFIADGTVVLATNSSGLTGTTATDGGKINVSDGGTVVRVTQNLFPTKVAFIRYWYIN